MQIPSIPYKILALGPFSNDDVSVWAQAPLRIEKSNLDQVIGGLGTTCAVSFPQNLCSQGVVEIKPKNLKDFHPDNLIRHNPVLRNIWEARSYIEEARKKNLSQDEINARLKQWPNLPAIKIELHSKKSHPRAKKALNKIFDLVDLPDTDQIQPSATHDVVDQLDFILRENLNTIFSSKSFQTLEATWQGVKLLLQQGGVNNDLELEIVPVCQNTLEETLSHLITLLIDNPPSLVLIDLPFNNTPPDLNRLEKIASFSETLLVPTITWITPGFLDLDTWKDLKRLPFLPHYLEQPHFAKWQRLKMSSAARWLVMTCNRFLVRYSYGINNLPRLIRFDEPGQLWISPVWALGALAGQSVAKTGWPTRFTEWHDIRLENLPLNSEQPENPVPTEASFSSNRLDQFIRCGIIPLAAMPHKDVAFTPSETTVSNLSLSYQLLVSRIAHLILWCRENLPKDLEGDELETELRHAFKSFWERSGHPAPEYLEISAGRPDSKGRIPIRIEVEPSPQVLPAREKVKLDFFW
jgi:predicted component of type VI protein secretion system